MKLEKYSKIYSIFGKLKEAYKVKKISKVNIVTTNDVNINIINTYRIIENELESWREVRLMLNKL